MRVLVLAALALLPLVAAQQGASSEFLDPGDAYALRFERAGSFDYYCQPHPYMTGRVVVSENTTATTANGSMLGFAFTPPEIRVAPGGLVTWTNRDETTHTVTFVREDEALPSDGGTALGDMVEALGPALPWVALLGAATVLGFLAYVIVRRP